MTLLKMGKVSPKKLEANRRNAQRSTGPRTVEGKSWSRRNALKHGILTSALLITGGMGWEHEHEFKELLGDLREDLSPVGMLEDLLVQKIAICCWRQRRALECESQLFRRQNLIPMDDARLTIERFDDVVRCSRLNPGDHPTGDDEKNTEDDDLERRPKAFQKFLSLPLGTNLDQVLRYETTNQRQLVYSINQLERRQRARKGEHVPAPVSVQVSSDG